MTDKQMAETIARISAMAKTVYSKEKHWKVDAMILPPGAKDAAIGALNEGQPFPFPPSYVQFLKLHDGCLNFWPKFAFLSTKGDPRKIVEAEIEDARDFQSGDAADEDGEITKASIARFEKSSEQGQYLYLPSHTVFAANKGGEFYVFNEKKKLGQGEYEVVHYTYDGGVYATHNGFTALLRSVADELERRIKEKGYS